MFQRFAYLSAAAALMLSCAGAPPMTTTPTAPAAQTASSSVAVAQPPVAKALSRQLEKHGHVRNDPYYWLKDRTNPEVIAYLEAENAYTDQRLRHTEPLQQRLYEEIVARIPQSDESVPYFLDGYFYYQKFEPGKEYAIFARRKASMDAPEEIMIDSNELAKGHSFFSIVGVSVSYGRNIVSFATDTVGRRFYTLRFRNLDTDELLPDTIAAVTGNVAWANDNKTIFYSKQHPETLRSYQIYRHELGTDSSQDTLVYEEADDTFGSHVFRTKSKRYIVIGSSHTLADEYRILEADNPRGTFRLFEPRVRGREYQIEHYGDHFYIRTNDEALNFRLMKTPVAATGRANWTAVIPHRPDVYLMDFEIFRDQLVLSERQAGLTRLRIRPWSGSGEHYINFGEPAYAASFGTNPEFDTPWLRYVYSSLTTPGSTYDYNMNTAERILKKRDKVGGGFDPANYLTERMEATARDGKRIPISLVYRKGFQRNGSHPLLLYGYGSYGSSSEASFKSAEISLLDRGFVYAIAHVRGGQEMGREWYETGKLFQKMNTFTDFIDVADFLVANQYADPRNLFAMGGSAGGLLMGAVVNMRPELWKGVVARVPFVDVITTMLEPDIPLTTAEYDEWGDPNRKTDYQYMLSYSPYDQVERKGYPNLLITTGLHDSQVQYWEPAKWAAKLRAMKTDNNLLLLKTNMEAGHGGASGRFRRHRETALIYAFLLDLAGRA
jgi:oligopeptidase B